jgi:hypothetical protein
MKKMIMMLAVTISSLVALASDDGVSQKVLNAFQEEFASAKAVTWTTGPDYFKAQFTFNEQFVTAFYNTEGELLGLTRFITSLDLPMNLQASLKKSYADFWISDLFEVTRSDSTGYYITLENADTMIVLKATSDSEWSVYKKSKKA